MAHGNATTPLEIAILDDSDTLNAKELHEALIILVTVGKNIFVYVMTRRYKG